jgi:probable HAF family extracellular repeat protein
MNITIKLLLGSLFCVALSIAPASAGNYVTFDIPGAKGTGIPQGVNKWGSVTGYWVDIPGTFYGFIYSGGKVTTFSVKVAHVSGTWPTGINDSGWVVGYFQDATGTHGFLRNPGYTVLDAPGAGAGNGQGTQALSINNVGEIAGVYFDSDSVEHGFVRDASGNYTSFDVPGGSAVINAYINQAGTVAGTYNYKAVGANYTYGYVMDASGVITTFQVPGSRAGNTVTGINSTGVVAGEYYPTLDPQGYTRDQDGNITAFDISGYLWTAGIEDSGTVVGTYQVANSVTRRGWQITESGAVSYFKDPSAGSQGTNAYCVSGNGHIAGYYADAQGNQHDFVESN